MLGDKRWKRRIVGGLLLLLLPAVLGCGNRAKDGAEQEYEIETGGQEQAGEDGNDGSDGGESAEETSKYEEDKVDGEGKDEGTGEVMEESVKEDSPWNGKKVSVCGDSISTFAGYIPDNYSNFYPEYGQIPTVEETWWNQVITRTGMELCRNASYSGSMVSGQSQDNHEGAWACGNQRIADLASPEGEWPDVILILMGTNDLLSSIPLGSYDGVSQVQEGYLQTFSEAYGLMLDKMQMWYPDAEIYCCTMAEVTGWNEKGEGFPFQNEHGLTAKNYNDCIKAVAQAKGIAVIDVYACGITYQNAANYTSDGIHPNAEGAALIADKVCEGLGN